MGFRYFRHFVLLLLVLFLGNLSGCALFSKHKLEGEGPLLWLANTSSVDFKDLCELGGEVNGPAGRAPRYEGFFDVYEEGVYDIPKKLQEGDCLSPEVEWVISFPDPAQIAAILKAWDEATVNDRIRALKVELGGMIEGKWLEVLLNEGRKPKWIPASGGNNVVASVGAPELLTMTVSELDRRLGQGGDLPRIAVYRAGAGELPEPGLELYASGFSDLAESDLIRGIRKGKREPVFSIVKAVLKAFRKGGGERVPERLRGISLDARGTESALLNDPRRREAAGDTLFYIKSLYAIGYFTLDREIIEMRMMLREALEEGGHCLGKGEEYLLYIYGMDGQPVGEARLRLGE